MVISRHSLWAFCVFNICLVWTLGLWPFNPHFPNEVSWMDNENGLRFGDYGTVLSSRDFQAQGAKASDPCSLELFLRPAARYDSNVMLAFSTDANPLQFWIRQDGDTISIQRNVLEPARYTAGIYLEHVIRQEKDFVITVTSDKQATSVYLNGQLAGVKRHFGLSQRDFTGQMVLGNSPVQYNTWAGTLKGVALFNRQLASTEVYQDYHDWTNSGHLDLERASGIRALYTFGERTGITIRDQAGLSPDLYIPEYFVTVRHEILARPWQDYVPSWGYWLGNLKNIIGFMPFGFCFCMAFSLSLPNRWALLAAAVTGLLASATIEIGQAFLPMRDSSVTDIMTNTLGTALGAFVYTGRPTQIALSRLGIVLGSRRSLQKPPNYSAPVNRSMAEMDR